MSDYNPDQVGDCRNNQNYQNNKNNLNRPQFPSESLPSEIDNYSDYPSEQQLIYSQTPLPSNNQKYIPQNVETLFVYLGSDKSAHI